MPALYSLTRIAITPTSIVVGLSTISPVADSVKGGDELIGFVAEYGGVNVTFVPAAERGGINE